MKHLIDIRKNSSLEKLFNIIEKLQPAPYWFEIKKYRRKRSTEQNAYYWGVVIDILGKEMGYYPEEMHEILKQKFNSKISILPNGEEVRHVKSTKKKDTFDFEQYLEKIRLWAVQEFGIIIPLPNESEEKWKKF